MKPSAACLLGSLALGCAAAPLPTSVPASGTPQAWWELPSADRPRQYLIRLRAEGPDERVDLTLTLRLEARGRFEIVASGPLGRRIWRLEGAAGEGVWQGESAASRCRWAVGRPFGIAAAQVDLPVAGLPALLLGRLPVAPRSAAVAGERWLGSDGREWSFSVAGGSLATWSVWNNTAEMPLVNWRRAGEELELELAEPPLRLRWRVVAEGPLAVPLPALSTTEIEGLARCPDALP